MSRVGSGKGLTDRRILRLVNLIRDRTLREKVQDLFQDPTMVIGGEMYRGLPLETSPAAKVHHHAYPKGLVQHMISATAISLTLCDLVEKTYHTPVNRDVVIATGLVHDIMKPLTYSEEGDSYGISPLGERVDHLTLAVAELIRRGFSLDVVHAVAAHHGKGGPTPPRTIEALICSLADSSDASLNGEILNAAKWLVRDCVGEEVGKLTAEEAFSIVRTKQDRGCAGVVEVFRKIQAGR